MNAFIPSVSRASYNRRRDLIAPNVSKITPKRISKMIPKRALWSLKSALKPTPRQTGEGEAQEARTHRRRDLIAPAVSKKSPKLTSKMTPKTTSGTPSGTLWSNPSPEELDEGSGSPNAYKTTEKPPPEPVGQEGRKARQGCSVERLRLPAFFDASFGSMLYVHINACNIFVIQMQKGIAINL